VGAFSFGAELAGTVSGALAVSLWALPTWIEVSLIVCFLAFTSVVLFVLPLCYEAVRQLMSRTSVLLECNINSLIVWSCLYAVAFIAYGMAHIFVLQGLSVPLPPTNLVLGVSALAWAVGTLVFLTPSGLGTRELILIYGLQNYIEPPELLALAIMSRFLIMFGELILFASTFILVASRRSSRQEFTKVGSNLSK
jgi:hypothetical protein